MASSNNTTMLTNDVKMEIVAELTDFPFLDLLPELQLKVLEFLVISPQPIFARELMPVRRSEKLCAFHTNGVNDITHGQPAITKVSRKIRQDALALYYSCNVFMMNNNVTEFSCMVPLSRFPNDSSTTHLLNLRHISFMVKIQDRCPNPANQKPRRDYWLDICLRTSKNKNKVVVSMHGEADTPERKSYLVKALTKAVGEPKDGQYDGHWLLRAAIEGFNGIICTDRKPNWRELDAPKTDPGAPTFGLGPPPNVVGTTNAGPPHTIQNVVSNYLQQVLGPVFGGTFPGPNSASLAGANPPAAGAQTQVGGAVPTQASVYSTILGMYPMGALTLRPLPCNAAPPQATGTAPAPAANAPAAPVAPATMPGLSTTFTFDTYQDDDNAWEDEMD
jgi:hypothetical protein